MRPKQPPELSDREKVQRFRHLGRVRRGFTRKQLNAKVGWAGLTELHRVDCPEYVAAANQRTAVRIGALDRVFVALVDDYLEGHVDFPMMHDCLRQPE